MLCSSGSVGSFPGLVCSAPSASDLSRDSFSDLCSSVVSAQDPDAPLQPGEDYCPQKFSDDEFGVFADLSLPDAESNRGALDAGTVNFVQGYDIAFPSYPPVESLPFVVPCSDTESFDGSFGTTSTDDWTDFPFFTEGHELSNVFNPSLNTFDNDVSSDMTVESEYSHHSLKGLPILSFSTDINGSTNSSGAADPSFTTYSNETTEVAATGDSSATAATSYNSFGSDFFHVPHGSSTVADSYFSPHSSNHVSHGAKPPTRRIIKNKKYSKSNHHTNDNVGGGDEEEEEKQKIEEEEEEENYYTNYNTNNSSSDYNSEKGGDEDDATPTHNYVNPSSFRFAAVEDSPMEQIQEANCESDCFEDFALTESAIFSVNADSCLIPSELAIGNPTPSGFFIPSESRNKKSESSVVRLGFSV